jgi:hypothetical protein
MKKGNNCWFWNSRNSLSDSTSKGYKVKILRKNSYRKAHTVEMVLDLTQVHHFTMPNVTELLKFLKNIL